MCENDAIVISDIHLSSDVCQAKLLEQFLKDIRYGEISTKELIINGDLFDCHNFGRLKKHHWNILSELRKLEKIIKLTIIRGNHDLPTEFLTCILGIEVLDDYVLVSGGKKIYFHHGHRYDKFLTDHPILVWVGDTIYCFLQWFDPSFKLARAAKHSSKHYLRNSEIIREKTIEYCLKHGYDIGICSHTHHSIGFSDSIPKYYNTGCFTELPSTYLVIKNGEVNIGYLS